MRVLFAGGGTAGHINPALAIAREIEKHASGEVLFVGTARGMEARRVNESGFDIEFIDIQGLDRKRLWRNFIVIPKLFAAIKKSKEIIAKFKPDIVIGTGGYVSGPVVYAAVKMGVKTLVHEVNAAPGLTTKILAKHADVVTISFDGTREQLSKAKRVVATGNPIRREILEINREEARGRLELDSRPVVLAFGGSLGAEAINEAMRQFTEENNGKYQIVWACGERYYDKYKDCKGVKLHPYIHDMASALQAADVVVTRGGGALFEITAIGRAAIIVPSPNVTNNHQEHNARELEQNGAASVILESEIGALSGEIKRLCDNEVARIEMENASRKMGKPEALCAILKIISEQ